MSCYIMLYHCYIYIHHHISTSRKKSSINIHKPKDEHVGYRPIHSYFRRNSMTPHHGQPHCSQNLDPEDFDILVLLDADDLSDEFLEDWLREAWPNNWGDGDFNLVKNNVTHRSIYIYIYIAKVQ